MDSDPQIIEACLLSKDQPVDGDPWRELCDRHFASVHNLAFKMTGDKSLADDLSQEIFLKVFRSLDQFQHKSKFKTWLYRIAVNTVLNQIKSNQRYRGTVQFSEGALEAQSRESSPEQLAAGREMAAEVDRIVGGMKPDLRAAIVLTSFQKLTPAEAASVVGCTKETFYWRLSKAREQIRKHLAYWQAQ